MAKPKIPQAGRSVIPHKTHTVKSKGKTYTYRGHKFSLWFTEDEIAILEATYNYIRSTKRQDFTEKERSTISKFFKAVILKYSKAVKKKYIDKK